LLHREFGGLPQKDESRHASGPATWETFEATQQRQSGSWSISGNAIDAMLRRTPLHILSCVAIYKLKGDNTTAVTPADWHSRTIRSIAEMYSGNGVMGLILRKWPIKVSNPQRRSLNAFVDLRYEIASFGDSSD